jgi:hypothetical protein
MNVGCSTHVRNSLACKDKWSMIASNFKNIFDFMVHIGQNQDYWAMNIEERNNARLFYNFGQGLYKMINELFNKRPIFQPPHMRNLMANGDGIFKPTRQTPNEPIELNDNFTILDVKVQYEYLNATNKVYAHIINEAWLYEQPQSTKPFPKRVNVPNASTPLKTSPMNLKQG